VLSITVDGQKAYGKEINLQSILNYFRLKLEGKFNVEQVIHALDVYTDEHNDIPSPADVIKILSPKEHRVTATEYAYALEAQRRNGYPMFSADQVVIAKYKEQRQNDGEEVKEYNKDLQRLAGQNIKRIK
jgi:hypothetical protein